MPKFNNPVNKTAPFDPILRKHNSLHSPKPQFYKTHLTRYYPFFAQVSYMHSSILV
jgi:hypothetical protein